LGHVNIQVFQNGQRLRRESLIEFDHVDVGQRQPCALKDFTRGSYRSDAHDLRFAARYGNGADLRQYRQTVCQGEFFTAHETGGGTVREWRRGSRGHAALIQEGGLELGQRFHCRAWPNATVPLDGPLAVPDGDDLVAKKSGVSRLCCPAVTLD